MKYLIKNKAWNISEDYNVDKLLYLLIDRPDEISYHDSFFWYNNKGDYHRNYNFPAFAWSNGDVEWYKNNERIKSLYNL